MEDQFYKNEKGAKTFENDQFLKRKTQYFEKQNKKMVSSLSTISDGSYNNNDNIPLGYEPNATNGLVVKQIWARPIKDRADEELEKGSLVFCKNSPMHQTFPIKDAVALADIAILNYLFDAYRTEYDTMEKCLKWNFLGVIRNEVQQYQTLLQSYKIRLFNVVVNGTTETIHYWKKEHRKENNEQSQIEPGEQVYLILKKIQKYNTLVDPNGNIRSAKHIRNVFQWIPVTEYEITNSFSDSIHFYDEDLSITIKNHEIDEDDTTYSFSIKKPSHIIKIGTVISNSRNFFVNGEEKNKCDLMID